VKLPEEKFGLVYADPPWRYSFSKSKSRKVENQYQTMSLEDIKALNIQGLCKKNAVLYLWATAPKIIECLDVMKAWGFTYKTQMIWDKVNIGMGYWARGRHEIILIGTRGKVPPPAQSVRIPSVITEKRGRHSAKPKMHSYFDLAHPDMKKIELFARSKVAGWSCWGNEVLTK
jgi:N6-adenosine-specific RNA methylase IME4